MQAVALSPTGCRKKEEHVSSCYHHTATHLPCQENGLRRRAADKAAEEHGAGEEQEGEEHLQPGIQRGDNLREDETERGICRHHYRHDEKGQREEQRQQPRGVFPHALRQSAASPEPRVVRRQRGCRQNRRMMSGRGFIPSFQGNAKDPAG